MSYARKGHGSSVYVFRDVDDGERLVCFFCTIESGHFRCDTPGQMVKHLMDHRARGEGVPAAALDRLEREARDEG